MRRSLLALFLLAACSSGTGDDAGTNDCLTPCQPGLQCSAGQCVPSSCTPAQPCIAGLTCINAFCVDLRCYPACSSNEVCRDAVCIPSSTTSGTTSGTTTTTSGST